MCGPHVAGRTALLAAGDETPALVSSLCVLEQQELSSLALPQSSGLLPGLVQSGLLTLLLALCAHHRTKGLDQKHAFLHGLPSLPPSPRAQKLVGTVFVFET